MIPLSVITPIMRITAMPAKMIQVRWPGWRDLLLSSQGTRNMPMVTMPGTIAVATISHPAGMILRNS